MASTQDKSKLAGKSGAESRPQGKTGENELRRLAKRYLVQTPDEDYAGWDIQLEEPAIAASSRAEFYGRPGYFTYKIQIKSPRIHSKAHTTRSVGIELQHLERACKSSDPWFVFIAIVDDDDDDSECDVHEVFLVHIGEHWIRKTAEKIVKGGDLKDEVSITWSDSDRIEPRTRNSLTSALQRAGRDPEVYALDKRGMWENAGLESTRTALSKSALATLTESELTEILLGRVDALDHLALVTTRFGVDQEYGPPKGESRVTPSVAEEIVLFRASEGSDGLRRHKPFLHFKSGHMFSSAEAKTRFPGHNILMRIVPASCVEIIVAAESHLLLQIRTVLGPPHRQIPLRSIIIASHVQALLARANRRSGYFFVAVAGHPQAWGTRVCAEPKLDKWQRSLTKAAKQAASILQRWGIPDTTNTTLASLLRQRHAIAFMHGIVCSDNLASLSFKGTVKFDQSVEQDHFVSPVPFCAAVQIGGFRAVLSGIMLREFRRLRGEEYEWAADTFEVVFQEGGERLPDSLPQMALDQARTRAELQSERTGAMIVDLAGFVQDRWPEE